MDEIDHSLCIGYFSFEVITTGSKITMKSKDSPGGFEILDA